MCIVNFNDIIEVWDCCILSSHFQKDLRKLVALNVCGSVHKVVVHNCYKMQQFSLEHLKLLKKSPKHELIFK